jgi:hypothetical protein
MGRGIGTRLGEQVPVGLVHDHNVAADLLVPGKDHLFCAVTPTGNRDAGPFHMTLIPMKPYPLRDAFADKHNGQKGNFFNQES